MSDKILNTRIQLKYDTLVNWQTKNTLLKEGEVAFVQIGEVTVDNKGNRVIPPVMFKVGPGNFNDLGWGAATAADVYGWAKAEHLALNVTEADAVNDGKYVNGLVWDSTTHTLKPQMVSFDNVIDDSTKESTNAPTTQAVKTYVDAEVQKAVSGGVEGLATEQYVDDAITALSAEGGAIRTVSDDLAAHKQAFGEFQTANTQAIADAVAAEAVIARAAEKVNADAIDAIEADYLKAADLNDYAKTADVVTNDEFTAFESTNTQAITKAQTTANEAKTKIDTFLGTITPDGSAEIIDTLAEINKYVGDHGEEFAELSAQVENTVPKVSEATADNVATFNADGTIKDSGFTIGKSVPANALFSDTTYEITGTKITNGTNNGVMIALEPTAGGSASYVKLVGANGITVAKDGEIYGILHTNLVDAKTEFTGTTGTLDFGDSFDVETLKYDAHGHITGIQKNTFTLPEATDISGKMDKFGTVDSFDNSVVAYGALKLYNNTKTASLTLDSAGAGLTTPGVIALNPGTHINVNNKQIKKVATPTDNTDAANKKYVDDTVGAVDTGVMSVAANDTDAKKSGIKIDNTDAANPKIELDDTITWVFDCGGAE